MKISFYLSYITSYLSMLQIPHRLRINSARTLYLSVLLMSGIIQITPTISSAEALKTKYQYSAKVICSLLTPHQDGSLARGTYRTVINIHNPTDKKITIAAKVALAERLGTPPGPFSVTPFKKTVLAPDGAVQVSCGDIAGFFCPINGVCVDFAFLDGFLVIKSPVELDVIGVYTARHNRDDVETMDIESVPARKTSEVVKVEIDDDAKKIEKHIPYPQNKGTPYEGQICGGIAGFRCPEGQVCVDDPTDDCDPASGGVDCSGICKHQIKPPVSTGPIPDTGIRLSETPCFGSCPEYTITVYPNEFYELDSGRFTKNPGQISTGTLPAGSFAAASTALQAANFNSLPTDITQGSPACGNPVATDLPTEIIAETTIAGTRMVTYYPGCLQAPDKAVLDNLVTELRTAFHIDSLVRP